MGALWFAGACLAGTGGPVAAAPSERVPPPWGAGDPGQVRTRDFELATAAEFGATGQVQALVIGISQYRNLPAPAQLLYAEKDAAAFRDFLISPQGGCKPENAAFLVNQEARQVAILRQLEKLQARCGPNDLAVIFFAGHGVVNASGQGFLLASDSRPDDLLVTAIEMNRFNDAVRHLRARSVVIFSDACHSGTIGLGPGGLYANLPTQLLADSANRWGQSAFVFSAASPAQTSLEIPALGHGLFTYHLLLGLSGAADADRNGLVTSRELSAYVTVQVPANAAALSREQTPEFNPFYDRSIPLAVLTEEGRKRCLEWFESDPYVNFVDSSLAEALERGALTRPERESAWGLFSALRNDPRAPAELVEQKRQILLARLRQAAQAVIDEQPEEAGRWEEAREWLEKAVELAREPDLQARFHYCLAFGRLLAGETGPAERAGDDALNLIEGQTHPDAALCLRLARLLRQLKQPEKARRAYRLAVAGPPEVDGLTEYAEVLLELGQIPEAETQLRRALEVAPESLPTVRLLGEVLVRTDDRGKILEALKIAEQALLKQPDDLVLEDIRGRALLKAGEPARAAEPLRRVAQARLEDGRLRDQALLNLSQAYAGCLELERAVSALQEARRRGSRSAAVYDALGELLERQGDLPGAIEAARLAESILAANGDERSLRLRRVAELQERAGNLAEAAFSFRDAARAGGNARGGTALERHASVLLHCAGRPQDAGALPPAAPVEAAPAYRSTPVIVPAGLKPLERLTGLQFTAGDPEAALASVFDACLRDAATAQRVIQFYQEYPAFTSRIRKKGFTRGGLKLPATGQPLPAAAEEALDFLGLKDKKDRRDIDQKDFYARRVILEGLGLDSARVARGEAAELELPATDGQLPVLLGLEGWLGRVKDGRKAAPEEQLLAFVRDERAMQLYVGLSMLPPKTAAWVTTRILDPDNAEGAPVGLYFAAPYLRCAPQGQIILPGERQGELNWQKLLEARSSEEVLERLLRADNWGALYLFAALSAAGEAGDQIARSAELDRLWRPMREARYPPGSREPREPFDLIDLLRLFRVAEGQLQLPPVVRNRLKLAPSADPLGAVLGRIGAVTPGGTIPLVRQMAAMVRIDQEMPEWTADPATLELLGRLLETGRDALIEVAIDLQLNRGRLNLLAARAEEVAAVADARQRHARQRAFQSLLELLRILARRVSLDPARRTAALDRFLTLPPGAETVSESLALIREDLLGLAPDVPGAALERELVAALAQAPPLRLPEQAGDQSGSGEETRRCLHYGSDRVNLAAMNRYLGAQLHTRLQAAADAWDALRELEQNPANGAALERLRAACQGFAEPEPPPGPAGKDKKKKARDTVPETPSVSATLAGWTVPVPAPALPEARRLIEPFFGEALLGLVYAVYLAENMREVAPEAELVTRHDFGSAPWGETRFDRGRRAMEGPLARLPAAMSGLEAFGTAFGGSGALLPSSLTPFVESILEAVQAVDQRRTGEASLGLVARTIGLGEQVLALRVLGDPLARESVDGLSGVLTPKRLETVRGLLDRIQVQAAIAEMTPSEKFCLGQSYLLAKIGREAPAELALEPGPLGALARAAAEAADAAGTSRWPVSLRQNTEQMGAVAYTRCGLHRLLLGPWQPYEFGLAVRDPRAMADRLTDFRLDLARACFKRGYGTPVALSQELSREALHRVVLTSQQANGGRLPPEKDWPGLIRLSGQAGDTLFDDCIRTLAANPASRPSPPVSWKDPAAALSRRK